jgi:TRAP-type uncharacterized transport system substrate-binding protein
MMRALVIRMLALFSLVLVLAMPARLALAQQPAQLIVVQIGGGYTTGLYYQSANAIAKIVNKKSQTLGFQCKEKHDRTRGAPGERIRETGREIRNRCL